MSADESERAQATLRIAADNPAAMTSHAQLAAVMDAVATLFVAADVPGLNPAQRALRSPRATWAAIHAHAEHRLAQLKDSPR